MGIERNELPRRWIIWSGVEVTRRKSYHCITGPSGEVEFRHRLIWPCIEWLAREGISEYELRPSEPLKTDLVQFCTITKGS